MDEIADLLRRNRRFWPIQRANFRKYLHVVNQPPDQLPSVIHLGYPVVTAGTSGDLSGTDSHCWKPCSNSLPWRKGPFNLFGFLWMRGMAVRHEMGPGGSRICRISPANGFLDIGASNGYYMFRIAARNPGLVLGLEPQSAFFCQYLAVQKYVNQKNVTCLPATYEEMPKLISCFDLVCCMGILYHRRSPVDMLKEIHDSLKPSGTLVLENLVIQGRSHLCLFPEDRYAKMRNVYFIPDLSVMESWLLRAGFKDIQCVNVTPTTLAEQRKTDWIQTESLADFLDPQDPSKTVEGYPAPVRAVFMARA